MPPADATVSRAFISSVHHYLLRMGTDKTPYYTLIQYVPVLQRYRTRDRPTKACCPPQGQTDYTFFARALAPKIPQNRIMIPAPCLRRVQRSRRTSLVRLSSI